MLHLSSERGWRGGERQVLLLASQLAALRVVQAVAAPGGSELEARARAAGVPVVPLSSRRPWAPRAALRLILWGRRHPGAVLHAHTSPGLDAARAIRRFARAAGVVYTRRTVYPVRAGRKYRTGADRYVAVSAAVAEQLVRAGAEPRRVTVIPSVVDVTAVNAVASGATRSTPPSPTVVCIAALAQEKRHDLLLAAWERVSAAIPGAELVLVGEGPQRQRIEAAAARLTGARVRVVGFRDDVPAWFANADLAVSASDSEGICGSLLEAMACARAVVATRVGGVPEVVEHGVTGLLVHPGDAEALAGAMTELLTDPERRAAMGAEGRRRVERRFAPASAAEAHLRLYRELTAT